jgi:hypothetical protein|tara:strand:- start:752 stop:1027 length:276 start_codon:yes stop_codon:yes gene_type:complete
MIEHTEKEMKKVKANMLILYMYFSERCESLKIPNDEITEIDFFLMWKQGDTEYMGLRWNEMGELQSDDELPEFYKTEYPKMITQLIENMQK